jgi:hypothetical protein
MENLPQDPMMLVSFINMKLRDEFNTLEDLCSDLNIDKRQLIDKLSAVGFTYSSENKRFW